MKLNDEDKFSKGICNSNEIMRDKEEIIHQLKSILDNLPTDVYWKDISGRYLGLNQTGVSSLCKMGFIKSCEDVIGKTDCELYPKKTADEFRKNDLAVMKAERVVSHEETALLPSGEKITQLSTKRPLYDVNGNVIGVLGNTVDITHIKKVEDNLREAKEKAEAANQAKEEFLKNMRHDLRTPFSGIFSLADWMTSVETDNDKKENLSIIADSAKLLLDYMNKILDAARRGEKCDEIVFAPLNFEKLIYDVVTIIKPALALKPVELQVDYPSDVPREIISDAAYLERIVMNLLGNAVKFTHEGKITVNIRIIKQDAQKFNIVLAIKDTGIGVPEDKREVIFDKFTRLDAAYNGCYSGMGLGLHDVKHLCEQLKGSISVSNNGDKGTVFTCTFPCRAAHIKAPTQTAVVISQLKPLKILLIEDQPIAARVAIVVLENIGHTITLATTARETLQRFNEGHYDLLLIDIGLPDINGSVLAQQIREQETMTNQRHTPLVALTAHQNDSSHDMSIFDKIINKPISLEVFNQLKEILQN
jgi:PAS domain S-box-containing protein